MKLKSLQINQNLEAMAKQLYDYWFVQFDFPDKNGKPYKSSGGKMVWNEKLKREIPEGWFASNICNIADILSGGTPSKAVAEYWENGEIPFFGPTDCNGNVFQLETADHITQEGLNHCSSSLFEEGTIIITARGSIGKLVVVGTPMAMNQSCYALQSKKREYEYLYFLTIQLIECLKAKGSGSVFKSIIASDIESSLLCIANAETITRFCTKICPLYQKIKQNSLEILELINQRNELLPLLMNGQVSVTQLNSDLVLSYIIEDIINQRTMKESIIQSVVMQMQRELDYRQIAHLKEVLAKELQNVEIQELPDKSDSRKQNNKDLLDSFLSAKKIEGCSDKTLIYYRSTIEHLFESVDIMACHIETSDIRQYLVKYQEQKGSSKVTIDNMRRIFSSFFAWLEDEDYIAKSPVRRIHKVKTDSLVKEVLTDEQLEQLRDNCSEKRDLAMIDLLTSTGIRVGELVKLNRKDIDFHERQCVVFGKGSKERMVYFNARTKLHLLNYLAERSDDEEALFVSLSSPHSRLTISGVETRIKELGKRLNMAKVHPHKFRRTMATMAIDKGMPIEQVQKLLGHVRIDTTLRYAIVNQNNVKMAHKKYLG